MMPQINIALCSSCGGNLNSPVKAPSYTYEGLGFPVLLVNAVTLAKCEACGETEITIPNIPGLTAAVALQRILLPFKLTGPDIRFVRKAIGDSITSALLAKHLEVTPETFSRWENDKLPISPTTEKLLRIVVGLMLQDKAPAMEFDVQKLADLSILSWDKQSPLPLMAFELVKVRTPAKRVEEGYSLQDAA
jgi:DNA-binding transcriptional regulator YiaG